MHKTLKNKLSEAQSEALTLRRKLRDLQKNPELENNIKLCRACANIELLINSLLDIDHDSENGYNIGDLVMVVGGLPSHMRGDLGKIVSINKNHYLVELKNEETCWFQADNLLLTK